jgi:hypothetical protein
MPEDDYIKRIPIKDFRQEPGTRTGDITGHGAVPEFRSGAHAGCRSHG